MRQQWRITPSLILLCHSRLDPLILRSLRSKRLEGYGSEIGTGASWFETALTRLLTVRV